MYTMETVQGLLGKLGRQCYAVFCSGVILVVSVTIAHYVEPKDISASAASESRAKATRRRLRPLHGPPLPASLNFY